MANRTSQDKERKRSGLRGQSEAGEESKILTELAEIKEHLKKTVKKEDIQDVVSEIVKDLLSDFKSSMLHRIETLEEENENLRDVVEAQKATIKELKEKSDDAIQIARRSQSMAIYNEQYSRKNNFKIYGIQEENGENITEKVCNAILKSTDVKLHSTEIMAVHRIPGKKGDPRPVIVKVINSEVKARVMRKRSVFKSTNKGQRLADDVTRLNVLLMKRLQEHSEIAQTWYFNGSVYAKTHNSERRIQFDIHDDITAKLKGKK